MGGYQSEFGIDEHGSLPLQSTFCFAFLAMFWLVQLVTKDFSLSTETMRSRPLLRVLLASIFCSAAGCGCRAVHNAVFAWNGLGVSILEVAATLWGCAAKAFLTVLQLLVAKGWALFYSPEEVRQ